MKAFTLVEILIVIAIIGILSGMLITSFVRMQSAESLTSEVGKIASLLEHSRSRTLASDEDSRYGVHFASSTVTVFKGDSYTFGDSDNVVEEINSRVAIWEINLTSGSDTVVFDRLTGVPDSYGNILLRLKNDENATSSIMIEPTGIINIDGSVAE